MPERSNDLVSVRDLDTDTVEELIDRAAEFEAGLAEGRTWDAARGRVLVSAFFEPSTRTRLSFESAMQRLGGAVTGFASAEGTSLAKGESLADTVQVVSGYGDVVVLRHPREGAARLAADVSSVPVINAGDGAREHPTQSILDLYMLRRELDRTEGLQVGLVGDLRHARTVRSLALLLARFNATLVQATAPELALPSDVVAEAERLGATVLGPMTAEEAAGKVDALYVTRVQAERYPTPEAAARVPRPRIDESFLSKARPGIVVLHPGPRRTELPSEVDVLPQVKVFDQAHAGVPVRMAILEHVLELEA